MKEGILELLVLGRSTSYRSPESVFRAILDLSSADGIPLMSKIRTAHLPRSLVRWYP